MCHDIHPNKTVSAKTVLMLSQMVDILLARIMKEAQRICVRNKRMFMTTREIAAACRLVLPAHISAEAVAAGRDASSKLS
jgi:histone H3/H4